MTHVRVRVPEGASAVVGKWIGPVSCMADEIVQDGTP
jgi:hypothetical protein